MNGGVRACVGGGGSELRPFKFGYGYFRTCPLSCHRNRLADAMLATCCHMSLAGQTGFVQARLDFVVPPQSNSLVFSQVCVHACMCACACVCTSAFAIARVLQHNSQLFLCGSKTKGFENEERLVYQIVEDAGNKGT